MDGQPHRLVFDIKNPKKDQQIQKERRSVQREKSRIELGSSSSTRATGGNGSRGRRAQREPKKRTSYWLFPKKLHSRLSENKGDQGLLDPGRRYYFIELAKRVEIAQQYGADLFISIHADASRNRKVHGASVYCLSLRGATDAAARFLADRGKRGGPGGRSAPERRQESQLDPFGSRPDADHQRQPQVGRTRFEGGRGGSRRSSFPCRDRRGFRVLKAPDVPSILVETGFISNYIPMNGRLKSTAFQNKMASALESAVLRFLVQPGLRGAPTKWPWGFAPNPNDAAHVVESGQNPDTDRNLVSNEHRSHQAGEQSSKRFRDLSRSRTDDPLILPSFRRTVF